MSLADYLVLAIITILVILVILKIIHRKKLSKTGCESCPYRKNCL